MKFSLPLLTDFITFKDPLSDDLIKQDFIIAHKNYSSRYHQWSLARNKEKDNSQFLVQTCATPFPIYYLGHNVADIAILL